MNIGNEIYNQISYTLAAHFECVYYVEIKSNHYVVFENIQPIVTKVFPAEGENFFEDAIKNADKYLHPDDIQRVIKAYDKESLLSTLDKNRDFSITFRSIAAGHITNMRLIMILCSDREHMLCCLENIEDEYQEKERQKKDLQSAQLHARRDDLTGIKNNNAFIEYVDSIDDNIAGDKDFKFGVVMCDVNDLKLINDTRGHAFGDEAIRATSRIICETFEHSPVFRTGGDEFVAVLTGKDYEQRDKLLARLRSTSEENRHSRTGPVIASGLAVWENSDIKFSDVLRRADGLMYDNKKAIKNAKNVDSFKNMDYTDTPIPPERKRLLDGLFGAFVTIAGGGYIYLNDMRYDFSRWALQLVDDFGLESVYMYHADRIWQNYIHPDDKEVIKDAVGVIFSDDPQVEPIKYRARKPDGSYVLLSTRGFVLTDSNGEPEYFGGIIVEE